jgi:hypothetical protein
MLVAVYAGLEHLDRVADPFTDFGPGRGGQQGTRKVGTPPWPPRLLRPRSGAAVRGSSLICREWGEPVAAQPAAPAQRGRIRGAAYRIGVLQDQRILNAANMRTAPASPAAT